MYFLVFHGKERYDQNPDAHHDDAHGHGHDDKPQESPWVVWLPLVLLAVPSVLIGYYTLEPMLYGEFFKDSIFVNLDKHEAMRVLESHFHGPMAMALHGFTAMPFWLALAGVALSYYMYLVNPALLAEIPRCVAALLSLLEKHE